VKDKQTTIFLNRKQPRGDGYLYFEMTRKSNDREFTTGSKYVLDSNGRTVEYSSSFIRDQYTYDPAGLVLEKHTYVSGNLQRVIKAKRDKNGLIREYVIQQSPFEKDGTSNSQRSVPVQYEFFD
jgi:hypothetical protein